MITGSSTSLAFVLFTCFLCCFFFVVYLYRGCSLGELGQRPCVLDVVFLMNAKGVLRAHARAANAQLREIYGHGRADGLYLSSLLRVIGIGFFLM